MEHGSTSSRTESDDSAERGSTGDAPDDGPLRVTVGRLADGFYVADDGPGIPPESRERVFERGYTTRTRGTGLGLAIVERIAGLHGWSVALAEAGPGARFEFVGVD